MMNLSAFYAALFNGNKENYFVSELRLEFFLKIKRWRVFEFVAGEKVFTIKKKMVNRIITFNIIAGLIVSSCSTPGNKYNAADEKLPHKYIFKAKDHSWKNLSLREKIGQTMVVLPQYEIEKKMGNGTLEGFFEKYPVSGFFMGWKLYEGIDPVNWIDHLKKRTLEYQNASKLPLIFQEDYESGVWLEGMTPFPREMALGACDSPELAFKMGKAVGQECKSIGINWVLHPVADLNMNPFNPITNTRSISDDPEKAIKLLCRQVAGLQNNGVAATIKHFPGDGVDYRDQHLTTTCNSLDMATWRKMHGHVFQALIDSGIAAIMPGHITLPAYQKEKINGFYPPATLSGELLTNLLKVEMGFEGVIVSDAMVMGGFRGYYGSNLENEIQSFIAGVDVLLWPSYEFLDSVEVRIKRGEIPMERLDDAVRRIWAMKERFGLLSPNREIFREMTLEEKSAAREASRTIVESSLTLVRDRKNALPLSVEKDNKILLVAVTPKTNKGQDADFKSILKLKDKFEKKGFKVDFQRNILYENNGWTEDIYNRYDRLIFLVARNPHIPFGPLQFWDDEAQTVWGVNAMKKDKTIIISLGSPYIGNEYFERVDTYINAYSNDAATHEALLRALLGEIPFKGISPVNIESNPFRFNNLIH